MSVQVAWSLQRIETWEAAEAEYFELKNAQPDLEAEMIVRADGIAEAVALHALAEDILAGRMRRLQKAEKHIASAIDAAERARADVDAAIELLADVAKLHEMRSRT